MGQMILSDRITTELSLTGAISGGDDFRLELETKTSGLPSHAFNLKEFLWTEFHVRAN